METVLTTRVRRYGLSEQQARSEKAATVIGRMRLSGDDVLSEAQYQAAVKFCQVRRRYLMSIESPDGPQASAMLANIPSEHEPDEVHYTPAHDDRSDEERAATARQRWDEAREAVMDAQIRHRTGNLPAALDYIVVRDEYHEHMEGDVKLALNALARLWGLDKVYASAA